MEIVKVSKEEFEKLKKEVKELSDEELNKVAGGAGLCPWGCHQVNNCCICPGGEDDV